MGGGGRLIGFSEQWAAKGSRMGTATVHHYPRRHFSIQVTRGEVSVHTHQLHHVDGTTEIAEKEGVETFQETLQFLLPDAKAAQAYQQNALGKAAGTYDLRTNSCVTHCGDVLRAGGVADVPTDTMGIIRWLKGVREQK